MDFRESANLRGPVMGYRRHGFALEVNPWHTETSVDAAHYYRGVIVGGWASVECALIEVALRCSRIPVYLEIRDTFPSKLAGRLIYLRKVLDADGPLRPFKSLGLCVINRYDETADLRNIMAHAWQTILPEWGATYYGFNAKTGTEVTYYHRRLTIDQLHEEAARSARFSRAVRYLLARLNTLKLLPPMTDLE